MICDDFTTGPTAERLPPEEQERLARILDEYLVAVERGAPVTPEELLQEHPADAKYLRSYLSGLELFHAAARDSKHGAHPPLADLAVQPGRTIADYSLLREIGRGGMGVVYEALQVSLRRRVALKLLPFSSAHDEKQISRFKNEAQAAAQVRHPNIVPVYAIGEELGVHYYAMELIEGQSLAALLGHLRGNSDFSSTGDTTAPNNAPTVHGQLIPRKPHVARQSTPPIPAESMDVPATSQHVRTVAKWGIEAAEALHAAHEYGVIHRDVKPSNLLLDETGKLWVTDFGLARCRETANLTQSGDILGTMRYMSPEQALGRNGLVDHRTDIYSLGVTLYELCALRHPADDVGDLQLFFDRARSNYRPLRHWNRHFPRDFETIVMKAIAEFPHERYATAQELADDLTRFNEGKPILASPPNLVTRAGKWAKRHQGAVYAAAAVGVLAVAALSVGLIALARAEAKTETALQEVSASQKTMELKQLYATHNYQRAREVLDNIVSRLAEQLESIPGAEGIRLKLLNDCVAYYQQLIDEASVDPTLDADNPQLSANMALTNSKIGDLKAKMGDKRDALACQENARALWQRLIADGTSAVDIVSYRRDLALCNNNIGMLLVDLGRPVDAVDALKEAERMQSELLAANPQSSDLAVDLATTDNSLGYALIQSGAMAEAAAKFRDSIARLEKLQVLLPKREEVLRSLAASYNNLASLEKSTDDEDAIRVYAKAVAIQEQLAKINHAYVGELAKTYNNLGYLASGKSDWKTAEAHYRNAMNLQDALSQASPADATIRRELAVTSNNLGMAQSQEGQFREAESSFDKAFELQRRLLAAQPDDVQNLSNLGGVYNNLGMLYDRQGRWAEAEAEYRKAVGYQQQAFEHAPDSDGVRELLSKHLFNYARNLRKQLKPESAAEVTLERKKLWPRQSDRLYSVAQELTAACEAMAAPQHPKAGVPQKYWQAAIDTLREALAAGLPADRLNDPSLKALSDREDFRELVVEATNDSSNSVSTDQTRGQQLN
ncbi:MAG TPA: serine/threonine-protein kinase [Lacipirellulaceae bacterium]|jgi:hypothetical protein